MDLPSVLGRAAYRVRYRLDDEEEQIADHGRNRLRAEQQAAAIARRNADRVAYVVVETRREAPWTPLDPNARRPHTHTDSQRPQPKETP